MLLKDDDSSCNFFFGSVSLGEYLEMLMNFFVIFVFQENTVKDLVITGSSVTDSVLVSPFQVSSNNISLLSLCSCANEELLQNSGSVKIEAREEKNTTRRARPNFRAARPCSCALSQKA